MINHVGIYIKLHKENDRDILNRLENISNKQGYIKDLIIKDSTLYKSYERGHEYG